MAKTKKKTPTKKQVKKEAILLQAQERFHKEKAEALFRSAYEGRERYDWEWLTRDLFRRGYQFSSHDPQTKTVKLVSRQGVKFPINLLWAQMKSVKNQVTNFKPKWEVLATGKSKDSVNNARYSGRLLDYYYHRLGLRKKLKEIVIQGLLFSVGGPWQIGYDEHADHGNGEVYIWPIDTYDFYIDPNATSIEEAEFCVKAVRKNLNEVTANPNYNFYGEIPMKGDSILAASPSKQFLIQSVKGRTKVGEESEEEGVILKEAWIKVRVSESNEEEIRKELSKNGEDAKKLRMGEVVMRIVHYIDLQQDPLLVQMKRTEDFPFVAYHADINPCEFYGESWAKHIIPINRVLNALESSVFTYHYRYAKGKVVIDKNSGVRLIGNQHGDFIEKNRGSEVSFPGIPSLPNSYQIQINSCRQYIEDLGGAHDVSLGRVPAGVKSGIGIAELKQADAANSTDLVDNMEDFLVRVGQKVLKEISQNYSVPKVIKDLGRGGDVEHFAAVGEGHAKRRQNREKVKIGVDTFDLAVIGADNEIRVTVGSWLAYTKTARQERIKELFNSGLIDQKTALQHLEFSDVDEVIESVRKEEVLKKFRGSPAPGAPDVSDEEIARQENAMMIQENREVEPLVTDNHTVHNIVHQETLGAMGNPLVEEHMDLHNALSKKDGPSGVEAPTAPLEAQGEVLPPQGPQGPPQQGQPQGPTSSPEEAALMKSLSEMGG